jgi:arylsulfatase A-like enzyme
MDMLPTIAGRTGANSCLRRNDVTPAEAGVPDHKIDGKDIWPLLSGQSGAKSPHEAFYYYNGWALQAVRSGKWKLHFPHAYATLNGRPGGTAGRPAKYEQAKIDLALFDLENDISEQHNVADQHPDVVKRLQQLADAMREDLGDGARKMQGKGRRPPGKA